MKETIDQFLKRGGKIQKITWRDVLKRDKEAEEKFSFGAFIPQGNRRIPRKMTDSDRNFGADYDA